MSQDKRLICVHHPKVPVPNQLSRFKGVIAERDSVKDFLDELYAKPPAEGTDPINPNYSTNERILNLVMNTLIEAVSSGFQKLNIQDYYYHKYVDIHIATGKEIMHDADIRGAKMSTHSVLDDIFGIGQPHPRTWGELLDLVRVQTKNLPDDAFMWVSQLHDAIKDASRGIAIKQITSHIRGLDGVEYAPLIHRMYLRGSEPEYGRDIHVIFPRAQVGT